VTCAQHTTCDSEPTAIPPPRRLDPPALTPHLFSTARFVDLSTQPRSHCLAVELLRVGILLRVERTPQLLRLVRVVIVRDQVIDAHAAHPGDAVVPCMEGRLQRGERLGPALLELLAERFRARLELSMRHHLVDEAERLGLLRAVLP